jgi:hypothetical protein
MLWGKIRYRGSGFYGDRLSAFFFQLIVFLLVLLESVRVVASGRCLFCFVLCLSFFSVRCLDKAYETGNCATQILYITLNIWHAYYLRQHALEC